MMLSTKMFGIRALRLALFLLFLLTHLAFSSDSSGRIKSLAISPDGKLLAVEFAKGNTSFIYKISSDTGTGTRLTSAKTGLESRPAFSPDGKRIAYSYSPGDKAHSTIVVGNVDGS
jgi:Tol biopolymer transport system component